MARGQRTYKETRCDLSTDGPVGEDRPCGRRKSQGHILRRRTRTFGQRSVKSDLPPVPSVFQLTPWIGVLWRKVL